MSGMVRCPNFKLILLPLIRCLGLLGHAVFIASFAIGAEVDKNRPAHKVDSLNFVGDMRQRPLSERVFRLQEHYVSVSGVTTEQVPFKA